MAVTVLGRSALVPSMRQIGAIVNSASNLTGAIAPGEIVVLYGSGLGSAHLTQFGLNSSGLVGTVLAGTDGLTSMMRGIVAMLAIGAASRIKLN